MILDIKNIVLKKEKEIEEKIKLNKLSPKLAVILANDNDSSKSYILSKRKKAQSLGILQDEYIYDKDVTEEDLINKIKELNNDNTVDGILVQLPLYKHINENRVLDMVDKNKDVDGFTSYNLGCLINSNEHILPCTPKGILYILDSINENVEGKNIVILGRSKIVGRPLAEILISRGATVTVCNSKTNDITEFTKNADILIVAIGKAKYVTADMIKKDSIIIDVGINVEGGKIVGDVDTNNIINLVKYVTPVPGGVGLTTVISLMDNLVELSIRNKKEEL